MKIEEIEEFAKQKKREHRMNIDKVKKKARLQLEGKRNLDDAEDDDRFIHRII